MSALRHLRDVAQGRRPADDGLLGNTRCGWGRHEVSSEEAILAAFAARPLEVGDDPFGAETASGAALVGRDRALFADVYDGRIGRLWRVGDTAPLPPEPAVDLAFDPDMRQERGSVHFRQDDHPDLDAAAGERLRDEARDLVERLQRDGELRVRAFVVRAFGDAEASAALLALHTLGNETSRSARFSHAMVACHGEDVRVIVDPSQRREWTPRL